MLKYFLVRQCSVQHQFWTHQKIDFFNDKINMFSPGFNSFQHLGYACAEYKYKYIQMKLFVYTYEFS